MNEVAFITTADRGRADAELVRRFKQAQTKRERAAVFADVLREHGGAVLGCCAERLWPDADAAVGAAGDVLIAARLAMADSAKLPRPDWLRGWLLGIAAHGGLTPGQPARADDISWEAVHAYAAACPGEMPGSPGRQAALRHWLEQIVETLPGPRQRLYDLFVASGAASQSAAAELSTTVAEVRRLRRENRDAILRAFEVTAVADAAAAPGPPAGAAPGCGELRRILADARRGGDQRQGGRRHAMVLPAGLRVSVARHLSQCGTCQDQRDERMARLAPELLPILAGTELNEHVMEGLHLVLESARPGARKRFAPVGTKGKAVPAAAGAGAGLLAVLLALALVWPGFLHSTAAFAPRGSTAPPSQAPASSSPSGAGAPQATGTGSGTQGRATPSRESARQASRAAASLLTGLPPVTLGPAAVPSSSAAPTPPPQQAVKPPASPASSPTQSASGSTPASFPTTAASSAAASPATSPSTPQPSTPAPSAPASSTAPASTPAPSTAAPSTTAPSTTAPSTLATPTPTAS